ncbi:uncharacterized protein LOC134178572 [Corticium candelabrum]|uniref:uncharacterized protein LOC134178572 n=1 Tax=Corticium candelabrum TaxID=121492 RepID=UPI002E2763B2|nr:uncharacterized protein LOC134178572 [Corticium candelabrum]
MPKDEQSRRRCGHNNESLHNGANIQHYHVPTSHNHRSYRSTSPAAVKKRSMQLLQRLKCVHDELTHERLRNDLSAKVARITATWSTAEADISSKTCQSTSFETASKIFLLEWSTIKAIPCYSVTQAEDVLQHSTFDHQSTSLDPVKKRSMLLQQ